MFRITSKTIVPSKKHAAYESFGQSDMPMIFELHSFILDHVTTDQQRDILNKLHDNMRGKEIRRATLDFLIYAANLILDRKIDIVRNERNDVIFTMLSKYLYSIVKSILRLQTPMLFAEGEPDNSRLITARRDYFIIPCIKMKMLITCIQSELNDIYNYDRLIRHVQNNFKNEIYCGGSNKQKVNNKNIIRKLNNYNNIKNKLIGGDYKRFTYESLDDRRIRKIFDIYDFISEHVRNEQQHLILDRLHRDMTTADINDSYCNFLIYSSNLILNGEIIIERNERTDKMVELISSYLSEIIHENLRIIHPRLFLEGELNNNRLILQNEYRYIIEPYIKMNMLSIYITPRSEDRRNYDILIRQVQIDFNNGIYR